MSKLNIGIAGLGNVGSALVETIEENKNYFFGTLIGMTPQLFIVVSLGSGVEKIINENSLPPTFFEMLLSKEIYLPIVAFIILLIMGFFLRKIIYSK